MILLEISKTFTRDERLLGEHRWRDMLKDPSNEEKSRVSQVFYCFYNTSRAAQKDGLSPLRSFLDFRLTIFFK